MCAGPNHHSLVPADAAAGGVTHVHVVTESVATSNLTPGHVDRTETPAYRHTHEQLVKVLDKPCAWCGVRNSDVRKPGVAGTVSPANPNGSTQLETHHYPIEWSEAHACDWRKVHATFPEVVSQETFEAWIDSPRNMLVLCDVCHRAAGKGGLWGIHHLSASDAALMPFKRDGYIIAMPRTATAAEIAAAQATDERISAQPILPEAA